MDIDNEIESKVFDVDDIAATDIKINPDYYIHKALIKAQEALLKDNMKDGLLQYRLIIEHIEVLVKSAKMLPNNYDTEINTFKQQKEFKNETNTLIQHAKLADKKLNLIMTEVFSKKVSTDPIKT